MGQNQGNWQERMCAGWRAGAAHRWALPRRSRSRNRCPRFSTSHEQAGYASGGLNKQV